MVPNDLSRGDGGDSLQGGQEADHSGCGRDKR